MRRMTPKRLIRLGLSALLLPLIAAAICYVKWITVDHRLVTVTPGVVYQSAAFAPDDLVTVCQDFDIKTVIDLRNEAPEAAASAATAATQAGITHVYLPTISHPTLKEAHAFLDALAAAERPVLVHCEHGEGRSVMMCALHRIQNEGWSNARAFDGTARLPDSLRFLNRVFPNLRRFKEEHTKGQFVLHYVARKNVARESVPGESAASDNIPKDGATAQATAAQTTATTASPATASPAAASSAAASSTAASSGKGPNAR
tara:strand:- start:814 stop:1590 length:777 start_codon:yes stop_codon:yes gene_type:complete